MQFIKYYGKILNMDKSVRRYFRDKMHKRRGKGRSYITELENLQVILAYHVRAITWVELCKFFNLDPADYSALAKADDIRQAAIEAGKELVR